MPSWTGFTSAALALLLPLPVIHGAPTSPDARVGQRSPAASVLPLKQAGRNPASSQALFSQRNTASAPLISAESSAGYAVDIGFGDQTFSVIFDTGSSDLWLPSANFACLDVNKNAVPVAQCHLHQLVDGGFGDGQIANENFKIAYGDGEFLSGTLGYEDVSLAGITVSKQEVALVNTGYWNGDGQTDGLMGFAFPSITSAFSGNDASADSPNVNGVQYLPFFFNAVAQGKVDAIFSMAIERGSTGGGGQLALGGLPDVALGQKFATTPLETIQLSASSATASNYSYYTIIPDGFTIGPASAASSSLSSASYQSSAKDRRRSAALTPNLAPMIVDSGTTLMYLPKTLADEINAAFDPPSTFIASQGLYENNCDAIPPSLSIRIGGVDFPISSKDLLLTSATGTGADSATGLCLTGVQPSTSMNILGDTFMKNVIAVFDIGNNEMRFAPHEY